MTKIEFIDSFELTEYIDSWRMASITEENFNIALTYLNLTEFKDFDCKKLHKVNKTVYIRIYLESPDSENVNKKINVKGGIAAKKNALIFFQITHKIIDDLYSIWKKSREGVTSDICNDLKDYLKNKRSRNDYFDQQHDDQSLINGDAFLYIPMFAKVRDGLLNMANFQEMIAKDGEVLNNSSVYLTIETVDFGI